MTHPLMTSLQAECPDLHAELLALEGLPVNEIAEKLGARGDLIQRIIAWIQAHPGQLMAWMQMILAMFGIVIPIPPMPLPTPADGPVA